MYGSMVENLWNDEKLLCLCPLSASCLVLYSSSIWVRWHLRIHHDKTVGVRALVHCLSYCEFWYGLFRGITACLVRNLSEVFIKCYMVNLPRWFKCPIQSLNSYTYHELPYAILSCFESCRMVKSACRRHLSFTGLPIHLSLKMSD